MSAPRRFTWRPDCNEDGRLRRIDVNRPAATFSWRPGHVSSIQRTERHGDATLSWRITPRETMLDSPTDGAASDASRAPRRNLSWQHASPQPPSLRLALAPSSLGSGTSLIPQEHKRKERFFINPAWTNWLNDYPPPPAEIPTPNVTPFIPCPFTNDLPYVAWNETKEKGAGVNGAFGEEDRDQGPRSEGATPELVPLRRQACDGEDLPGSCAGRRRGPLASGVGLTKTLPKLLHGVEDDVTLDGEREVAYDELINARLPIDRTGTVPTRHRRACRCITGRRRAHHESE